MGLKWQHFIIAANKDGEMIGCGQVKRHWDGSQEVASIAVRRPWRNRGVASAIITRLIAGHSPPLWLTCVSGLVPFYNKFNFREVKAPHAMPLYFRIVFRLFNFVLRLTGQKGYLAVMVYEAEN